MATDYESYFRGTYEGVAELEAVGPVEAELEAAAREGRPADLVGVSFEGFPVDFLKGRDLRNASMEGCRLYGMCLDGAVLDGAVLDGSLMSNVSMRGVSARGLSARQACLYNVTVDEASDLRDADFLDATFERCDVPWERMEAECGAFWRDYNEAAPSSFGEAVAIYDGVVGCDPRLGTSEVARVAGEPEGADPVSGRLVAAVDVELSAARGEGRGADLHGLDLSGLPTGYLEGRDLRGANLEGCALHGLSLDGADLGGANLSEASLTDARLRGVRLDGANLDGAWFLQCTVGDDTTFSGASMVDASFDACDLDVMRVAAEADGFVVDEYHVREDAGGSHLGCDDPLPGSGEGSLPRAEVSLGDGEVVPSVADLRREREAEEADYAAWAADGAVMETDREYLWDRVSGGSDPSEWRDMVRDIREAAQGSPVVGNYPDAEWELAAVAAKLGPEVSGHDFTYGSFESRGRDYAHVDADMVCAVSDELAAAAGEGRAADLHDLQLSSLPAGFLAGRSLAGANLSGCEIDGLDLSGCDLAGANLAGSVLRDANLRGADLSGTDLSGVWVEHVSLDEGTRLEGADVRGASFEGCERAGVPLGPNRLSSEGCENADKCTCDLSSSLSAPGCDPRLVEGIYPGVEVGQAREGVTVESVREACRQSLAFPYLHAPFGASLEVAQHVHEAHVGGVGRYDPSFGRPDGRDEFMGVDLFGGGLVLGEVASLGTGQEESDEDDVRLSDFDEETLREMPEWFVEELREKERELGNEGLGG